MKNINLSFTNSPKKKTKEKVILTYHGYVPAQKGYYTYIDSDNNEKIFDDLSYTITKVSATKYNAKKTTLSKIDLKFVPEAESVEYCPAYFTYNTNEVYLDSAIYDKESNSYIGKMTTMKVYDKEIRLYEE